MAHTPHRLPAHKPRYLMGVGTPEDLVAGVAHGVDMFDCVMPTRNARNGWLFTRFGDVKIRNAAHPRYQFEMLLLKWMHLRKLVPLMDLLGLPATARASFACYSTLTEVEQLVDAVCKAREVFA